MLFESALKGSLEIERGLRELVLDAQYAAEVRQICKIVGRELRPSVRSWK
jgi:hypothetical protein